MSDGASAEEILRKAKIDPTKCLRFGGRTDDGAPVVWYVHYQGKFGWYASNSDGFPDRPDEEDVKDAFEIYDRVRLVDRSDYDD